MSDSNTTPAKKEYRIVTSEQLKKIMRRYKYVWMKIDYLAYYKAGIPVDKRYVIETLESYKSKYTYMYEIDDNYEHTLYIERVIRTPIQPTGGTVDTPGVNLVP